MKTDLEIQQETTLLPIERVAEKAGIYKAQLSPYGNFMAKVLPMPSKKVGKLVLVTAINPTAAGEGKTTVAIGLGDALKKIGTKVCLALREPSLGPVFGIKGGATGGGYAQVGPMEEINLHFTGDMHAITSANNLLCSMIDNHIYWGLEPKIRKVSFKRCLDMNDRALRAVEVGKTSKARQESFTITAASEIMAILCLANDEKDLIDRLEKIAVGTSDTGAIVTAKDIGAVGAMAILLKEVLKPNLVQTLEGTPALIHGGPFANIAHGCNSIIATKTALGVANVVVTEAGFGADLGAEKFLNIKCRSANIEPNCVVIVASLKALKALGGKTGDLSKPDRHALIYGSKNLEKHISNIHDHFGLECVVAINSYHTDTQEEVAIVKDMCSQLGVPCEMAASFANGAKGSLNLAKSVMQVIKKPSNFKFSYSPNDTIKQKIETIATKIYGADRVEYSKEALSAIVRFSENPEFASYPICIAKTQYSLSDNPKLLAAPEGFAIKVKDIELRAGAKMLVVICGDMLLMPALSKAPSALGMKLTDGKVEGLF